MILRLTGIDITQCRQCGHGTLQRVQVFDSVGPCPCRGAGQATAVTTDPDRQATVRTPGLSSSRRSIVPAAPIGGATADLLAPAQLGRPIMRQTVEKLPLQHTVTADSAL